MKTFAGAFEEMIRTGKRILIIDTSALKTLQVTTFMLIYLRVGAFLIID